MIVAEIIPITSSILAESLSYFSTTEITPGTIVTIPLRKQEIRGIVISTTHVKNLKQNLRNQNFKIRNVIAVHNETIFSSAYLKTIQQLKNYYVLPAGKLIDITYPKYITKNFHLFCYGAASKTLPKEQQHFKSLLQKSYRERITYYENLVTEKISNNQSVHIICPTVLDVKKITKDLEVLFSNNTYSFHGKISKKKLEKTYTEIQKKPALVISTVNFIDVPAQNKITIILENDSSSYYFRAVAPHIDLRIFIEEYAKNSQIELIIADSIIRPSRFQEIAQNSIINTQIFSPEKISLISAYNTKAFKQTDEERIKDLSNKRDFSPFSDELLKQIKKSVKNNEKIFFYTRRKSLAPSIMCRDCGQLAQNTDTKNPYSLYVNKDSKELFYIDRVSGDITPAFDLCQFCNSWKLQTLGIGTETIKSELQKVFSDVNIQILDSTHAKNQTEINQVLKTYNSDSDQVQILIGTQKSLPFLENIDSSYIVSIDGVFSQTSYCNETRALSIIQKIYEATKKHTFVQTRNAGKDVLKKTVTQKSNSKEKDVLQLKFSKQLSAIVQRIKFSEDFIKNKVSRYTESLAIWSTIKTGNYIPAPSLSKKTIIKINHHGQKSDYQKLHVLYANRLVNYRPVIHMKYGNKRDSIILETVIHIDSSMWNSENQDSQLLSLLPFGERNINIQINPDIF